MRQARQEKGQQEAAERRCVEERRRKPLTSPNLRFQLVRIRPGESDMGFLPGDSECWESRRPQHHVRISKAFEIGQISGHASDVGVCDGQQPQLVQRRGQTRRASELELTLEESRQRMQDAENGTDISEPAAHGGGAGLLLQARGAWLAATAGSHAAGYIRETL